MRGRGPSAPGSPGRETRVTARAAVGRGREGEAVQTWGRSSRIAVAPHSAASSIHFHCWFCQSINDAVK